MAERRRLRRSLAQGDEFLGGGRMNADGGVELGLGGAAFQDRKSTRLNPVTS